jgi:hypothetical protein
MEAWLGTFRTRIFGNVKNNDDVRKLDAGQANLNTLENGSEFTLREGTRWLRFWIPALEE